MDLAQLDVDAFEARVGYRFKDRDLLLRALTHKSYSHESRDRENVSDNETYEFLGDSVLGFLTGELLFRHFADQDEGALSKMKAYLVSATILSRKARDLGLGEFLRLGVGEEKSGGRRKDSLLANLFEAVVAGIYLDGGIDPVRELMKRCFSEDINEIDKNDLLFHDYKTALQEIAQANGYPLPEYQVLDELGPDHSKTFVVEVRMTREVIARGEGSSKKEAQQQAARLALQLYAETRERVSET